MDADVDAAAPMTAHSGLPTFVVPAVHSLNDALVVHRFGGIAPGHNRFCQAGDAAGRAEYMTGWRRMRGALMGINKSNWWAGLRAGLSDAGTVTAEYAVATLGACGFAGLLLGLLRSGEIKNLLFGIVKRGLNLG